MTFVQLDPSAKAPWTRTTFFTGGSGWAVAGREAAETATVIARPRRVVDVLICSVLTLLRSLTLQSHRKRQHESIPRWCRLHLGVGWRVYAARTLLLLVALTPAR